MATEDPCRGYALTQSRMEGGKAFDLWLRTFDMKAGLRVLDDLDDWHEARAVIRALVPIPPEDERPAYFQAFIAQVKPRPAVVMREEEQASGCDKPQKLIMGGGNRHG